MLVDLLPKFLPPTINEWSAHPCEHWFFIYGPPIKEKIGIQHAVLTPAGTDSPGSRDLDWDDWGTNDLIRQNWDKIKSGATGGYHVEVTSDWSPQKIAEDVAAVVGVVLSLIPLIFSGGSSNKSSDPNYGRPEDYPPGGLPPPDQEVGGTPH